MKDAEDRPGTGADYLVVKIELEAMLACQTALEPLTADQRRRALTWLRDRMVGEVTE